MSSKKFSGDLMQWLRGFYFVAEKGSVTQAGHCHARASPRSPTRSSVWKRNSGSPFFDRFLGQDEVDPRGEERLEHVITLFEDVKEIRNTRSRSTPGVRREDCIVASHAVVDSFLPRTSLKFITTHPAR